MAIDDHGLTRVPVRAKPPAIEEHDPKSFPIYPYDVRVAIRQVKSPAAAFERARTEAARPLSAAGKQLLEDALKVIAENANMEAQLDADDEDGAAAVG